VAWIKASKQASIAIFSNECTEIRKERLLKRKLPQAKRMKKERVT
jgi:hypothetical protein